MSVLGTSSIYMHCPHHLRDKIQELDYERTHSGIETTPDETSEVIESLFEHLGRLWMAEVWHAIEIGRLTIEQCDGMLLSIIGGLQSRSLTTGSWVKFSREISNIFNRHNLPSFVLGLDAINWGTHDDNGLVAKILDFRNRFAHGDFNAPEHLINVGYKNLDTLIQQVPGLWTQRWHVLTTDGWHVLTESSVQESLCASNQPSSLVLEGGQGYMNLTPFFSHSETEKGVVIHLPMWQSITVEQGLQQEQISAWYQLYRREYAGLIDRSNTILNREYIPIDKDIWSNMISPLLTPNNQTTLLVGHPGTGLSNILPSILYSVQQNPSDIQWMFWDVKPQDLTLSASCFVRALGELLQPGIFTDADGRSTKKFKDLNEQLDHLKPLFEDGNTIIAVDGLQYAHLSYRSESHTVIDVCNRLTELNVTLLLLHHPAKNNSPIFFTTQISWPITAITDKSDFMKAYEWLDVSGTPLYERILQTLHDNPNSSLFEVCDILDAANDTGPPVFEPEVEYALWHLRPFLTTKIQSVRTEMENQPSTLTSIRTWSTFSKEVTS